MIIDTLSELKRYIPVVGDLQTVQKILDSHTLLDQDYGSYATDNPKVRYNLFSYTTEEKQAKQFEIHARELDVQILLIGYERMAVADPEKVETVVAYDEQKDARFVLGRTMTEYHADPTHFALFFPGEPHCCNLVDETPVEVVKVVFKILA